jgi:hypothetical protein
MKTKLSALTLLAACLSGAPHALAQGSAFTYQGRLSDSGGPANGAYAMQFTLKEAASGGSSIGVPVALAPLAVSNGLFTATLDFGGAAFTGAARWLEIGVRTNGSVAAYTVLVPRQALTPTPYAMLAGTAASVPAANISGTVSTSQLPANVARLDVNETFTGQVNFNGGNVGIGTTSPDSKLTLRVPVSTPVQGMSIDVESFGSELNLAGSHYFRVRDLGAGTTPFTINGLGNVGIGTTTPMFPLTFQNVLGDKLSLWSSADGSGYGLGIQHLLLQLHTGTPQADIAFGSGASTNFSEVMRIKGTGNIGIGTSYPIGKLHVQDVNLSVYTSDGTSGPFTKNGLTVLANPDAGFSTMRITSGHSGVGDRGLLQVDRVGVPYPYLFVRMDGAVGIGTASPGNKLSVAGVVESTSGGFKFPDGSVQTTASSGGGGGVGGSGTAGYVPKFTASTTVGNSALFSDAAGNVGIGQAAPQGVLDIVGSNCRVVVSQPKPFLVGGTDNGGALYFGAPGSEGNAATAAIEASWGGVLNPRLGIGVVRDGARANILMDYTGNTDIRNGSTTVMHVGGNGNVSVLDTLSANTVSAGDGGVAFSDGSVATSAEQLAERYYVPMQEEKTASATWTVPAGVSRVRFRVWGGGGGGSSRSAGGGGGGGGGFAQAGVLNAVAGETFVLTVGGAGAVGAAGGQSKVVRSSGGATLATANGGAAGSSAAGGAGGTATTGQIRVPGVAGDAFNADYSGAGGGPGAPGQQTFGTVYGTGGNGNDPDPDWGGPAAAGYQGYILIEY